VQQLSEGHLDVVVPKRSEDEFGELTEAFNRMARQVRGMVQDRERLLVDVSHELRSPLTRIKVALEMLPDEAQRRSMAADVVEMETLVTELLELHRLGGAVGLRLESVDLVTLTRDVCAREEQRAPGVRITAASGTARIQADVDGVRTVLRNVIDNALKYSLPQSQPVEVTVEAFAQTVRVRVRDDGEGVAPGDLQRLFDPFFRADPSRSKRPGGFGLGLSICKRIMEAHGGMITVEAGEPRGLICVMEFPRTGRRGTLPE
jgi:signal transduction histidine kinase